MLCIAPSLPNSISHSFLTSRGRREPQAYALLHCLHGAAAQIRALAMSLPGAKQGLGEESGFLWQLLCRSASLP